MRTASAIRTLAVAALLPALLPAWVSAAPGRGSEVSEKSLRRFEAGARKAALVVVELEYSLASGQEPELPIRRAKAVARTLRLRAPRHRRAVRVRVTESMRRLAAEAPIEP